MADSKILACISSETERERKTLFYFCTITHTYGRCFQLTFQYYEGEASNVVLYVFLTV